MAIIEIDGVSKRYFGRAGGRALSSRAGVRELFLGRRPEPVTALDDVTFQVEAGASLGIIGANGSGKSTLLKLIAGVTSPSAGTIRVGGRVASLLELGAGFHPMLTGRENVYLNAGLLGMRRKQVRERFDDIAAFSGIGGFIDHPVDTYSSGMYVRLAFAVAVHTNPDIFLIDEVLSVGDEAFQRKCRGRIGELREQGKTILFVSHDLAIVNTVCNRVVLLSQGRMVMRDSASKAITFYLAQVGAAEGVHTLTDGAFEAVLSNGRIALFHNHEAITSASGFLIRLSSHGAWHASQEAEWRIAETGPGECVAEGRMTRLPVVLRWHLKTENGALTWRVALQCEQRTRIDAFELMFYFSPQYAGWTYDDDAGEFPEFLPQDLSTSAVIAPEGLCEEAGLAPREAAQVPPMLLSFSSELPNLRGYWANTDYMTGCRLLQTEGALGARGEEVPAGEYELMTVTARPLADVQSLREAGTRARRRTIESGEIGARFERGCFRISYRGTPITASLHLYASLLIQNLWNDSQNLRWDHFEERDGTLLFRGMSRRFPFALEWRVAAIENGLSVALTLEAREAFDAQEYHTTIVLVPEYSAWKTEHESGAFSEFDPASNDWKHLNVRYEPSAFIEASGDGLPTVRLESDNIDRAPIMTPINTGVHQHCRVLQALHAPRQGAFHFEAGRHAYFEGRVLIAPR